MRMDDYALPLYSCWVGWLATMAVLVGTRTIRPEGVQLVTAVWTLLWAGMAWGITERRSAAAAGRS